MAKPFVADVKEMARGVSWVKFLVKFNRIARGETGSESAIRLHADWIGGRRGPSPFGCGDAKTQRFNFDDDKAVFTFATEPYSTKSNDYYKYIFEFGRWVDVTHVNPSSRALAANLALLAGSGATIDELVKPSRPAGEPAVKIKSEMEVRSFISRVIGKHTV